MFNKPKLKTTDNILANYANAISQYQKILGKIAVNKTENMPNIIMLLKPNDILIYE
ncbi:hypothetical protein RI543_002875 [Arxiozyma heterogenica]|uniref:Uncharacterized protein n=1 Tax=Arxiozyma heterogenica TaxID=278026 RepID=A0AAN7WGT5_9SACH|nr:hypothetical protein RI543_002875 [Kazachstania heterogenica]